MTSDAREIKKDRNHSRPDTEITVNVVEADQYHRMGVIA